MRAGKPSFLLTGLSYVSVVLSAAFVLSPPISENRSTTSFSSSGKVVKVYDGDTIGVKFSDGYEDRVRLIGIDTPELDDPREEVSLQAHLAWRFTRFYLLGREVFLTYDQTQRDKHGRILAFISVESVGLFNEFILKEGFAAAFFAFPFRSDYQERFRRAQKEARQKGRGLWLEGEPEEIPASRAASRIGSLVSVRFHCSRVRQSKSFIYLQAENGAFEALIPRQRENLFPSPRNYLRRTLVASGFLEEYHGRPQILVFFPRKLRVIG